MTALLVGLLGLVIGSFLNVVVWRVPRGESVIRPGSRCPACGAPIRPYDNVPVLSWLMLRGRCRDCKTRVSPRYPLVELTTGVAFAAVGWHWQDDLTLLPALLYLGGISIALTLIDLDHQRLPDVIVLPSYAVVTILLVAASFLGTVGNPLTVLGRALAGAVLMFLVYFLAAIAYPRGMGFGDVKLAGVLGLYLGWFGWGSLAVGFFAAFLLGGLFSVGLVILGGAGRKTTVPFGPWMLLGAWVGLLAGDRIWDAYLGMVGF